MIEATVSTRYWLAMLSSLIIACGAGGDRPQDGGSQTIFKVHGLNFSPYMDGQDPNLGTVVDSDQIRARMQIIEPYTDWIRTYGSTHGLETSGAVARSLGLKAALGAWLDADLATNENEIENLIAAAKAGEADLLIVGSEVLLRGELSEEVLIDYLVRVKSEVPDLPVAYADTYGILLAHPKVLNTVDVFLVNYFPYWEGISIDAAMETINTWHQQVKAASNGTKIIVGESGWPSDGNAVGLAVPSPESAARYFRDFVSWAEANDVEYFYFSSFDERWKSAYEGSQGAHWGVWDKDGKLKPGMGAVFDVLVPTLPFARDSIPISIQSP